MGVLCKCGKELITEANKTKYTVVVSSIGETVDVIDCYECNDCKAVVSVRKKYDKEVVMAFFASIEPKEEIQKCIAGEILK